MGIVGDDAGINCVHVSFGQVLPGEGEETKEAFIERCVPITHVILSESGARLLMEHLKSALEMERGEKLE